jgi:hypothetical protein
LRRRSGNGACRTKLRSTNGASDIQSLWWALSEVQAKSAQPPTSLSEGRSGPKACDLAMIVFGIGEP